ncbi:MAG: sodium:solute symporter family protein [Bacteroidetes bacterium]|nr:sodium:solute symporter family protein [Bacteroidota bacterium]MBU1580764.1 sodium:solute symporter family protein [Bacteroidota bacterium]MBU2558151.1 sodium:solute symporter family protein [Bacteroidota bacterium]
MNWIDLMLFIVYMAGMLGVGYYFHLRNKSVDDYYVGGRGMGRWHIGLSVVATDVGGGFSIGLGGLGFVMGLSGSWMLFTGLIGAWLAGVFLIPRIKQLSDKKQFFTFPEVFGHFYGAKAALLAGLISGIGYLGFTSSQLLAGAKLASAAFVDLNITLALTIMGFIAVVYTVLGGIKAVIYTDTVQWILLMSGLIFLGIPLSWVAVGGWEVVSATLPDEYFSFSNLSWQQFLNWMVTILPIWFVGMTLYQRIYASRSASEARKAWFIAGVFEWPIMAFMGVGLGMLSRVAYLNGMFAELGFPAGSDMDAEMGLPLLLRTIMPVGLMGLILSAYFSAILSTADSCLMASSSNFLHDLIQKIFPRAISDKLIMNASKLLTLLLGVIAVLIALKLTEVLSLMLYSYAFMVSGLLVPLLAAVFLHIRDEKAAIVSMITGGGTTISLIILAKDLPLGLDANVFGIFVSLASFIIINSFNKKLKHGNSNL